MPSSLLSFLDEFDGDGANLTNVDVKVGEETEVKNSFNRSCCDGVSITDEDDTAQEEDDDEDNDYYGSDDSDMDELALEMDKMISREIENELQREMDERIQNHIDEEYEQSLKRMETEMDARIQKEINDSLDQFLAINTDEDDLISSKNMPLIFSKKATVEDINKEIRKIVSNHSSDSD